MKKVLTLLSISLGILLVFLIMRGASNDTTYIVVPQLLEEKEISKFSMMLHEKFGEDLSVGIAFSEDETIFAFDFDHQKHEFLPLLLPLEFKEIGKKKYLLESVFDPITE